MYLAREYVEKRINYYIRESYPDGDGVKSREICNLGTNPGKYVIYPDDGVSFYFDPELIETIEASGAKPDTELLEKIFFPFLHPETRRVIEMYSRPSSGRKASLRTQTKRCETAPFHIFDMRRMHYLRYGELDMRKISVVPRKIYRKLLDKSRDEIEQQFMEMENVIEEREKKNYMYAVFNVAGHFESDISRKFPQALDQEKVDDAFIQEVCAINADESFWGGVEGSGTLNEYLKRYVFWFFDNAFSGSAHLADLMWQFRQRRHNVQQPSRRTPMPLDEALTVMEISKADFPRMTVRSITRQYRAMAHKYHPDKGGDHDMFIRLNRAFRDLLGKVRKRRPAG